MADQVPNIICAVSGILLNNPLKLDEVSGKYKVQILLDDVSVKKLQEVKAQTLKNKFGSATRKVQDWLIRYGDDEKYTNTFEKYFIISKPKGKEAVQCFIKIATGELIPVPVEEIPLKFYPGAHVSLSIDVYALDEAQASKLKTKPLITSSVRALLFLKDGERIGMGGPAIVDSSEFGDLTSEIKEDNSEFREDA